MEDQGFCLYITYLASKKKLFFSKNEGWEKFITNIKKTFQINQSSQIKIFELESDAEIESPNVIEPHNNLYITVEDFRDETQENQSNIDLKDLIGQKIHIDQLSTRVNEWAARRNFQMVYREGMKDLKKGKKREMRCNTNGCGFKLSFKSDEAGEIFELDEKLSSKHSLHSGKFLLKT